MADLCIQIHPHRAPDLDLMRVRETCAEMASDQTLIRRFAVVDGTDKNDYLNLMFATDDPSALWKALQERLYQSEEIGESMRASSMAMCEGKQGWEDYLLLHHFDPAVPRDSFE